MPKNAISDYSQTAASNTDVASINIDEGMSPSNVNNALRAIMAHLADLNAGASSLGMLKVDNVQIDGNAITSTDTNGNITITPNGTGAVVVAGLTLPNSDGTADQVLKTNGAGGLSFVDVGGGFDAGTKMIFNQTSSPTGWTKDTASNDDSALRVTTGTVGTGGSSGFATAMATPAVSGSVGLTGDLTSGNLAVSISGSISNTTLTTSQIPSHRHGGYEHNDNTPNGGSYPPNSFANINNSNADNQSITLRTGIHLEAIGGGLGHNHAHTLAGSMTGTPGVGNLAGSLSSATASINVKYVDVIVATKD
jgi:microcystin-dependent protein